MYIIDWKEVFGLEPPRGPVTQLRGGGKREGVSGHALPLDGGTHHRLGLTPRPTATYPGGHGPAGARLSLITPKGGFTMNIANAIEVAFQVLAALVSLTHGGPGTFTFSVHGKKYTGTIAPASE